LTKTTTNIERPKMKVSNRGSGAPVSRRAVRNEVLLQKQASMRVMSTSSSRTPRTGTLRKGTVKAMNTAIKESRRNALYDVAGDDDAPQQSWLRGSRGV
jgi:hypothetical protein